MLSAFSVTVRCLKLSSSQQLKIIRSRYYIDRTKMPILSESDLEENIISGSGPGGQSVNKAVNCCQIKHKPTGIVVKCHQHRMLQKNRDLARQIMIEKLDDFYNGEASVSAQKRRLDLDRSMQKEERRLRLQALRLQYRSTLKPEHVKGSAAIVNKESDDQ